MELRSVDVCNATGITAPQYANYESGVSRPNIEDAIRYSDAFDIPLDWIFKGNIASLGFDLAQRIRELLSKMDANNVT